VLAVRVDERRIRPAGGDGAASPRRDDEPANEVVVEVERRSDTVRITITGEVDLANAAVTEQQILAAIIGESAVVTLDSPTCVTSTAPACECCSGSVHI
jgi:hypothetical protein